MPGQAAMSTLEARMFARPRWFGVPLLLLALFALPSAAAASDSSRDGRIAFQGDYDVYVMDSNGSDLRLISTDPVEHAGHPLWSPDGTRLAFSSDRAQELGGERDIYVAELGSGRIDRVTWGGTGGPPLSWSPDGESIALVAGNVYLVNVADGFRTQITSVEDPFTQPETLFASPTFSPDGSRIAYVEQSRTFVSGGPYPWSKPTSVYTGAIFVSDLEGSHVTRLTNSPAPPGSPTKWTDNDRWPAWSPDGTQIAFSSDQGSDEFTDLFVINADGTGRHQLTDGTRGASHPAWSPDGTKIAWSGDGSFVADSDGTNKITLGGASYPEWSSDGMHIAVSTSDGIATVHPDGSEFTVLEPDASVADPVPGSARWQPVFPPVGLAEPETGIWRLRDWGGETAVFYYGNPGDYPFVGDWHCTGTETPGLYRQSDGFAYLRNSNTQGIADIKFNFGDPGDVPLAGDFNGDGCDTLSIYRPSEARFYIINQLGENEGGLGAAEYSFLFGNPGDSPVVGDWDGDGIDEIGLHRESTGFFYYRNTLTTGVADGEFYFGDPDDRFIAGDWGVIDGRDTPAVYRPSNTTFYFRYTLNEGNADSQFIWPSAENDWTPIAGAFHLD